MKKWKNRKNEKKLLKNCLKMEKCEKMKKQKKEEKKNGKKTKGTPTWVRCGVERIARLALVTPHVICATAKHLHRQAADRWTNAVPSILGQNPKEIVPVSTRCLHEKLETEAMSTWPSTENGSKLTDQAWMCPEHHDAFTRQLVVRKPVRELWSASCFMLVRLDLEITLVLALSAALSFVATGPRLGSAVVPSVCRCSVSSWVERRSVRDGPTRPQQAGKPAN